MFKQTDLGKIELRLLSALAAALGLDPSRETEVGHEGFTDAPNVGTFWQDRERPARFFFLISKHECSGHTRMRMLRVDRERGGAYAFMYENPRQWAKQFKAVERSDVPGVNPAASTVVLMDCGECKVSFDGAEVVPASELTDEQIGVVVKEHGDQHPGLREFLESLRPQRVPLSSLKTRIFATSGAVDPFNLDQRDRRFTTVEDLPNAYSKLAEQIKDVPYRSVLDGVPQYMQQFLDALDFNGNEVPPAVGERYFSWISSSVYRVVDASRKLHREDYYVTMEREHDGHRAKFTFRDHATWLAVWRPVDPEGNARPVEMVDVPTTTIDLTRGESYAIPACDESRESNAERQLNVIYRELDRKVPGWREAGDGDHVFLDDVALALRAIRSLSKHMNNYRAVADTLGKELRAAQEHAGEQLKAINTTNKRHSAQMRESTDLVREMLRAFCRSFDERFGREAFKQQLVAFNATSIQNIPFDQIVPFMERCRAYARQREG